MARVWILIGALSALSAVAAGAFGAHALKARLSAEFLAVFETGVRYQMYHAFGLLFVGLLYASRPTSLLAGAGFAMAGGTVLFSGSLYLLVFTGMKGVGAITPIGGVAFMVGWVLLAIDAQSRI